MVILSMLHIKSGRLFDTTLNLAQSLVYFTLKNHVLWVWWCFLGYACIC